jgi:hypothetical protein
LVCNLLSHGVEYMQLWVGAMLIRRSMFQCKPFYLCWKLHLFILLYQTQWSKCQKQFYVTHRYKNIFDIFVDFLIFIHVHYMKIHRLSSSLQRRNIFWLVYTDNVSIIDRCWSCVICICNVNTIYVQQYTSFSCIWCLHLAIDSLCKGQ